MTDIRLVFVQKIDFFLVNIETDNRISGADKGNGKRQSDIAEADDTDTALIGFKAL